MLDFSTRICPFTGRACTRAPPCGFDITHAFCVRPEIVIVLCAGLFAIWIGICIYYSATHAEACRAAGWC